MSKATLLAESLGAHWCSATALIISGEELEAFYHAARAEEREACALLCEKSDRYRGPYFAEKIRERT